MEAPPGIDILEPPPIGIEKILPNDRDRVLSITARALRRVDPVSTKREIQYIDVIPVGTNHIRIRILCLSAKYHLQSLARIYTSDKAAFEWDPYVKDVSVFPNVDKTAFLNTNEGRNVFTPLPLMVPMLVVEVWTETEFQRRALRTQWTEEPEPPIECVGSGASRREGSAFIIERNTPPPRAWLGWMNLPEIRTWKIDACEGGEDNSLDPVPPTVTGLDRIAATSVYRFLKALHAEELDVPTEYQYRTLPPQEAKNSEWCLVALGLKSRVTVPEMAALYAADMKHITGVYYDCAAVPVKSDPRHTVGGLFVQVCIESAKAAHAVSLCAGSPAAAQAVAPPRETSIVRKRPVFDEPPAKKPHAPDSQRPQEFESHSEETPEKSQTDSSGTKRLRIAISTEASSGGSRSGTTISGIRNWFGMAGR